MAYIPWWQRYEAPTFAERFELGGLAGRQKFDKGSSPFAVGEIRKSFSKFR